MCCQLINCQTKNHRNKFNVLTAYLQGFCLVCVMMKVVMMVVVRSIRIRSQGHNIHARLGSQSTRIALQKKEAKLITITLSIYWIHVIAMRDIFSSIRATFSVINAA